MAIEEIELFRCYFCMKYKPMTEHKSIMVKNLMWPKDVCSDCFEKSKTTGIIGFGLDPVKEKEKDVKETVK